MECDANRMCELLVGLPDVNVLAVDDADGLTVVIETRDRPVCLGCGRRPRVKDRDPVLLVDLPVFGRPSRLLWRKHRWQCVNDECAMNTWTVNVPAIAPSRLALTDRGGPVGHPPGWPVRERCRRGNSHAIGTP